MAVDVMAVLTGSAGLLWQVVSYILALSIIVFVHEYGHYIVGRWSGIRADVFSLGFGRPLFGWTDRRGTRWQVAAIPLGGFVRFRGDGDAASATKDSAALQAMTAEDRRQTMAGAPLWARAATVAAGPLANFLLAIVVFTGMTLVTGLPTDVPTVGRVKAVPGYADALHPGDVIVAINGTALPDYAALTALTDAGAQPAATYDLRRAGAPVTVTGPWPSPPLADAVQPGSAADAAGLRAGDVVTAVDGQPVYGFSQLRQIVGASGGRALELTVWRPANGGGQTLTATLVPRRQDLPTADGGFETRWLIGLSGGLMFEPATRSAGPLEAVSLAATGTWRMITLQLSAFQHMVMGKISTCNLGGPIRLAETSGAAASAGVESFISLVGMLSVMIGLVNLFPVPVLDGGHLAFFAWEAVTGRPPAERALQILMAAGLAIILGLMAFGMMNDITCP